jgi:eukaryotic-like serine/threonine-protein kinase
LCTNRKACDLLFPPPHSLRVRLRRFTVLIVFVMAGLLNVLAGAFNYIYNLTEVIGRLGQRVELVFQPIQAVINAVTYPIGAVLFWYLGYSVYRGLLRCQAGAAPSPNQTTLRRRCVRLGHIVATISIVEWAAAGIIYPIALQLTNGDLPKSAMFHFFFSLLLCGLPAAAYPFFGITFFSLRSLYPVFVVNDLEGAARDEPVLAEVKRWNSIYLGIAAVAPLLGIAAITVDRRIDPEFLQDAAELAMEVFSAVGLLMLPPVFWLFHSIQSDLQTYSEILGFDERELKVRQLA